MEIIDNRTNNNNTTFGELKKGDCFFDKEGELFLVISPAVFEGMNGRAIRLQEGCFDLYYFSNNARVTKIKATLNLYDL